MNLLVIFYTNTTQTHPPKSNHQYYPEWGLLNRDCYVYHGIQLSMSRLNMTMLLKFSHIYPNCL